MTDLLRDALKGLAAFEDADALLRKGEGPVQLSGVSESLKAYIIFKAGDQKTRLVVSAGESSARALLEDLRFFDRTAVYFPPKDLLFYQADAKSNTIARERLRAIRALLRNEAKTVVTTAQGMMNALVPFSEFEKRFLRFSEGDVIDLQETANLLSRMGYERVARVEEGGTFAIHGGILDIFDLTADLPYRMELYGDEIDTVRTFHASTQLSASRVKSVDIFPASEFVLDEETLNKGLRNLEKEYKKRLEELKESGSYEAAASLQDLYGQIRDAAEDLDLDGILERFLPYFYDKADTLEQYLPEDLMLFLDEPPRILEEAENTAQEFKDSFSNRYEKGLVLQKNERIMRPIRSLKASFDTPRTLALTGLDTRVAVPKVKANYRIDCQSVVSYAGNAEGLFEDLRRYQKLNFRMVLLAAGRTRASRMADDLREKGLRAYFSDETAPDPGSLLVTYGALHRGFSIPLRKFVLLTENDVFGAAEKKKRRQKSAETGERLRSFKELSSGDYVVHENYGIGIYRGIVNIEQDGVSRDYMKISYAGTGVLYIPVTNLDVVQKYASSDSRPPKISRLDSPEWEKTKNRVRNAAREVADELVNLYAARSVEKGFRFGKDTPWQEEFEELFPFEETYDQLHAIQDVKADMESEKIMDRLICGDVGFGKTEVALRAAFKAVMSGKQVAYLVPTTILAKQHFNTFRERMQPFPVNVRMLSRFSSQGEVRDTISGLKDGSVDIVIGTHKLLSKEVSYKDLGLLIIDEEQRFGVGHKEKIKQLRKNVDALTLTATPIPRTLHMSMIGIRDMSLLSEPPEDRKAVQTYVMEYEPEIVREAIRRETNRGGQVYYVYNRAQDIADIAAKIKEMLPDLNVDYIHGRMAKSEIEDRMLSLIDGETDVFVSTTIIETGIDIPNVNTIIIHDSERYGLAQLYQLRGRVGRSSRQAYAFIMYRKDRLPNEEAQKRLEAIRQFTELGSGVRIAKQDLEIRGAGAVLGEAQSGHMTLVGYDLYVRMLKDAVLTAKGEAEEEPEHAGDTVIKVTADAYLPDSYIPDEGAKLEIYKRISQIRSEEDSETLQDELVDRFGDIPRPVLSLLSIAVIRAEASRIGISEISGDTKLLRFTFFPDARIRTEGLPDLITEMRGALRYVPKDPPALLYRGRDEASGQRKPVTKVLKELLDRLTKCFLEADSENVKQGPEKS